MNQPAKRIVWKSKKTLNTTYCISGCDTMKSEELNEMFKEATKWVTESEYKTLKRNGNISVMLQHIIFSPEHNEMFRDILANLTKEQVTEVTNTIAMLMEKLNNKEMGIIIVALTYLITETIRKFGEEIQGEIA